MTAVVDVQDLYTWLRAGDETVRTMGTAMKAATLLHWKADWQRDVDDGRTGLDEAYPHRSVDVYPPLVDVAPGDVTVDDYAATDASQWLPGTSGGNPPRATSARQTRPWGCRVRAREGPRG